MALGECSAGARRRPDDFSRCDRMVKERNFMVQVGGWMQSTMLMSMFIIPDDYFFSSIPRRPFGEGLTRDDDVCDWEMVLYMSTKLVI